MSVIRSAPSVDGAAHIAACASTGARIRCYSRGCNRIANALEDHPAGEA
jgi:hypothetical protein